MRAALRVVAMVCLVSAIVIVSYLAGFGTSWVLKPQIAPLAGEGAPSEFSLFWEVWDIIKRDFYGEIPEAKELTYGAIGGAIDSLNDPHTFLVRPEFAEEESIALEGYYEGVGIVVTEREGHLVVVSPITGSPAMRAGVRAGDVILKVDGMDISGMSLQEVIHLIRGPRGSTVKLTFFRLGSPEPIEIELVRAKVDVPSVTWESVEEDIGYIRLSVFSKDTGTELRKAINELKKDGATNFILDLRDNPGGLLRPTTIEVTSQFLAHGVVLYEQFPDGSERSHLVKRGGLATDEPLVVLINRGTASAPEIVAGALQDHQRATLVGENSFGKGRIQVLHTLRDGSKLHVSIASWLTPDHRQIHEEGLTPDIIVPLTEEEARSGVDTQLERAIEYLKSGPIALDEGVLMTEREGGDSPPTLLCLKQALDVL